MQAGCRHAGMGMQREQTCIGEHMRMHNIPTLNAKNTAACKAGYTGCYRRKAGQTPPDRGQPTTATPKPISILSRYTGHSSPRPAHIPKPPAARDENAGLCGLNKDPGRLMSMSWCVLWVQGPHQSPGAAPNPTAGVLVPP